MTAKSKRDNPLPHSKEAEVAILGSILIGGSQTDEVFSQIQPTDFFLTHHQVLFRHMQQLHQQGKPTDDIVLLCESLAAANELETVGGVGNVSQILDGVPRVSNVTYYVEIVLLKAQIRHRAYTAQTVLDLAVNANGNAADVLKEIGMLSAHLRIEAGQKRILAFRSGAEIAMATDEQIEWIVPGFAARGAVTELGAKVKTGKTTLVLKLVRAVADGSDFLGRPTVKTATVYLTEQPMVSFRQAMERADLLGRLDFHLLQHTETRGMPWPQVAAEAAAECKRVGATLLVVDTLPQFAGLKGDAENNSGDALEAMEPLLQAAADGIGIIIVRHERKAGGEVGDSGRGSSAFAGAVDIVFSLRKLGGNSRKTQRVLQALSRFSETPAELLVDLTERGYVALGDPHEAGLREAIDSIVEITPYTESEAITLKELAESAKVLRSTAQRAVEELLRDQKLARTGDGKRGRPYRYFRQEIR